MKIAVGIFYSMVASSSGDDDRTIKNAAYEKECGFVFKSYWMGGRAAEGTGLLNRYTG